MSTYIHTLYLNTVKTSVTKLLFKNKTHLHVCRVGVRGGQLGIYLISEICIGSNGSDLRSKAIPQMCSTVAEATF